MSYTPNNVYVYNQAFSGAVAGLVAESTPLTTARGSYSATIKIAGAWAQEVDTQWGPSGGNPDAFQYDEIFAFSNDLFQVYEPQPDTGAAGVGSSTNPATYQKTALALLQVLNDGETYLAGQGITPPALFGSGDYAFISQGSTSNGQGFSNANSICALIQTVALKSGIFDWSASADMAAAAAGDVVTWTVTSQQGTGTPVFTNGSHAPGGLGSDLKALNNDVILFASGAAGTGIGITAGGGGELTQDTFAETIGTAAVGSRYEGGGTMQNSVTNIPNTNPNPNVVPFTLGDNVFLILKVTNSVANRAVTSINMSLKERAAA